MKKILFLAAAFMIAVAACKKAPEKNPQGVWLEKSIVAKFAGTNHWVRLNADNTFEMKLTLFTDAMETQPTSCPGNRTDYVKGNYSQSGDQIILNGKYCDSTFNQLQANCKGNVDFNAQYAFRFAGEDMVWDYQKEDQHKIWLVRQ